MSFLFYLLMYSSVLIATALTPVSALLSFVFFITLTVPLFLIVLHFEYFAFLFLIVYLGALVILFLFVIISLDGRSRREYFRIPLSLFFYTLAFFIIFNFSLNNILDIPDYCTDFIEMTSNNIWPSQDIDLYIYSFNELGFLIIIAALVLILSLFCVIVIGDFIKKL